MRLDDSTPSDYVTIARCVHCRLQISHGGTSALDSTDLWFTSDDDFACPGGDTFHQPPTPRLDPRSQIGYTPSS